MTKEAGQSETDMAVVAEIKRGTPVRVKLKRIDCNRATPYPPDGMSQEWWQRLKDALGTCSSDFVEASLFQLVRAARLPGSGTSEVAVNAALAFIEGAEPRDEVEAALVIQMACTHSAVMSVFSRFGGDYVGERTMTAATNALARLLKAYAMQVETLRRLRNGGSQLVRVEHVHVNEGGQAIVGPVAIERGGANQPKSS
jgi:hypothetical protein